MSALHFISGLLLVLVGIVVGWTLRGDIQTDTVSEDEWADDDFDADLDEPAPRIPAPVVQLRAEPFEFAPDVYDSAGRSVAIVTSDGAKPVPLISSMDEYGKLYVGGINRDMDAAVERALRAPKEPLCVLKLEEDAAPDTLRSHELEKSAAEVLSEPPVTKFQDTADKVFEALDRVGSGRIERTALRTEGPRSYSVVISCARCFSRDRLEGLTLCAVCHEAEVSEPPKGAA